LEWLLRHATDGSTISSIRRLRGGTSSAMHAINARDPQGQLQRFVLRRHTLADWLAREPDLAEREAFALELLDGSDALAPQLIAVDPDGSASGLPSVLMSRLPGRLGVDTPVGNDYLAQLAAALPAIHEVQPPLAFTKLQRYYTYNDLATLTPPTWSRDPAAWHAIIEAARGSRPLTAWTFIHRDYHPGNTLWSRGRLTGVVDWVNASYGPPGIDIGHCRVNLAIIFGPKAADRFLEVYLERPGSHPYQVHWDCVSAIEALPGPPFVGQWLDGGRKDLTVSVATRRLDSYVASLAARL